MSGRAAQPEQRLFAEMDVRLKSAIKAMEGVFPGASILLVVEWPETSVHTMSNACMGCMAEVALSCPQAHDPECVHGAAPGLRPN